MRFIGRVRVFALLLLMAAGLGGCAARAPVACPTGTGRTAKVYFATDRARADEGGRLHFGPARTDPPGLHVGWEEVALGPKHALGKLDDAVAITPRFQQDDSRTARAGTALNRSDAEIAGFVNGGLRAAIRAARPPRPGQPKQVLVYIHGYNNTFDYALRKSAQLAGDLELVDCDGQARGVAISYSWPAQGTLLSYLADEENAEWTQQRLVPFLDALAHVCQQEHAQLNLMAHSLGSRALIRSLADIANSGRSNPVGQVILLAPDIGKGLFDQYLQRMLPLVQHLTLYVSARDRALSLSRLLHGGHDRVGLIETTLLTALSLTGLTAEDHRDLGPSAESIATGKVDMIDVSRGLAVQLGHSYEDPNLIQDLRELIYHNTPAGRGARSNLTPQTAAKSLFRSLSKGKIQYFQMEQRTGATPSREIR